MIKEFEFELKESEVTYNDGSGTLTKAKKLILKAPSNNQIQAKYADRLNQAVLRAMFELENKRNVNKDASITEQQKKERAIIDKDIEETEETEETEEEKANGILMILRASNIDITEIKKDFFDLLMDGACYVDGVKKISRGQIENQMSYDEANLLLGRYISTFLGSSLSRKKKKNI